MSVRNLLSKSKRSIVPSCSEVRPAKIAEFWIDECESAVEICDCDAVVDVRESARFASLLDSHCFQHVEGVELSLTAAL
jgi:hypothetical protein